MSPKKTETSENKQLEISYKNNVNRAVSAKVNALRQKVAIVELERTCEREQLTDSIESLQQMLADEKSERRQLTALLSDQREKAADAPRRGLWARLTGR